MADENSEQHEMGDLHDTDNTDNLNKVQDNDNVNGIDNVQGTDHVHDAEQVHEADHVHDTEDVHNTDNIHVSDTIHGVNIKHEETEDVHSTDNIHDSDSIHDVNIKHEETHPSEEVQIAQNVLGSEEKRWPGWPGENVFRMLVPAKKVGGIIGRRGEYIKKTCEETKARIKVLDGPHGTTERAVLAHIRKHFNECGLHTRRTKIQTAVISIEHYKC